MQWIVSVSFITIMIVLYLKACPEQALALIAELKRQLRLHTIQRSGKQATQELAHRFRQRALAAGYEPQFIEQVLKEQQGVIVERLGVKAAEKILGEPTPLERYY